MSGSLNYIDLGHPFYLDAVAIRIECFFKGMDNAAILIQDSHEADGIHLIYVNQDQQVLGTGRLNIQDNTGIISQMAIRPKHQQMGIGKVILEELYEKAKLLGVNAIKLSARETAIPFYARYGFKSVGEQYPSKKTGIIHQQMVRVV